MENTIFKYEAYRPEGPTELISIQIAADKEWSETPATFHEIPKGQGALFARFLANSLKTQIRMTYPRNRYSDIFRLSGSYISWDQFPIKKTETPSIVAICTSTGLSTLTYQKQYDVRPFKSDPNFYKLVDDRGILHPYHRSHFILL